MSRGRFRTQLRNESRAIPRGKGREGIRKGKEWRSCFQDLHLHRYLSDAPKPSTAGAGE